MQQEMHRVLVHEEDMPQGFKAMRKFSHSKETS